MDFTLKQYQILLQNIKVSGYVLMTMQDFMAMRDSETRECFNSQIVVLRHDVDERPTNALKMALIESSLGIKSTYYFRAVKISNDPDVIKQIVALGHEIGYHYEDYSVCNGLINDAKKSFSNNLNYFRQFYPVKTVCMHGSSFSKYDNRIFWDYYKLSDFGLVGEPYLTIDYSDVFYITDTGRRWDGNKYSMRDKISTHYNHTFRSTKQIIHSMNVGQYPSKAIIQTHTLWSNNIVEWVWLELRERLRSKIKVMLKNSERLRSFAYTVTMKYSNPNS